MHGSASGAVRLATPEVFSAWLVSPDVGRLRARHSGVQLELVSEARQVSLIKREADLARLVARKLADYSLVLYASRAYLDKIGRLETLAQTPSGDKLPLAWQHRQAVR